MRNPAMLLIAGTPLWSPEGGTFDGRRHFGTFGSASDMKCAGEGGVSGGDRCRRRQSSEGGATTRDFGEPALQLANGNRVTVGRGRDRGDGLRAGLLPGDPPCLAEIYLHRVRCDHPGPGSGDADAARTCDTFPAAERVEHRRETAPLLDARFDWAGRTVTKLSGKLEPAKAFRYTITRREALTRFVTDGRRTTTWPRMRCAP